jgi:hypothetical protein
MNWIYNGLPDTGRLVIVASRAPKLLGHDNVIYTLTSMSRHSGNLILPDSYELIAWADFPRCMKDANGIGQPHHWMDIEGLKQ